MLSEIGKATAGEAMAKPLKNASLSTSTLPDSPCRVKGNSPNIIERQEKIAIRHAQIPRAYRATYNRAVKGRSLRAAINAQCLECVCWQRKEVALCTDLACPLYAVRPYQLPQNGRDAGFSGVESKNSE